MSESERTYALDLEASRSVRCSIPLVRRSSSFLPDNPGESLLCIFLGLVIACEVAVLAWAIWSRK